MSSNQKAAPYLALGLGILCLSLSAIFVRTSNAPGIVASFYRMLTATLILLPMIAIRSKGNIRVEKRWLLGPLAAGFITALDHGAWSTAISYTSIANANLINFIAPVWVALIAWLFWKQKMTGKFWLGLVLVIAGMSFVFGSNLILHPSFSKGDALALLSSFFFAGYYLITQRSRSRVDALTSTGLIAAGSAATLLVICLISQAPLSGYPLSTWMVFIAAGIISQICGYFCMTYALGHIPASIVSPTMIASPVISALLAIPIAGEPLSAFQVTGGILVFVGIYLVNRTQSAGTVTLQAEAGIELEQPALPPEV
ncbi:membrane protein [Leptolinea sp. HRD-7]|nr:membrane protein [Leptolinea sp. HRD-7]